MRGSMATVSEADIEALYASGEFDPDFYLRSYPDVGALGLDPAAHFLWIGARLGRLGKAPRAFEGSGSRNLDVLFVDGTNGTTSTPYRVDRIAEGLVRFGASVRCIRGDELDCLAGESIHPRHVTFFRAPFWGVYRSFAEQARARGSRIVFDVDDLVFEEEQIPFIDGYRHLSEADKAGYVRGVRGYRDFILFADFCTAPTEFLAARMRSLGKKAYRVRNTLNEQEIAKFAKNRAKRARGKFVVGYYSGSRTHQADFKHAGEALVRVMDENPSVVFRLVGEFDLREYPDLLKWSGDRVIQLGLMTHSAMLEDQLECDLIIAPLEVGNAFCEAKSELKFFEASLAGKPVIASRTQTFRFATKDGEHARLADTSFEWLEAFRDAIRHADRLIFEAKRAHEHVIEEYSPAAAGRDAVGPYSGYANVGQLERAVIGGGQS